MYETKEINGKEYVLAETYHELMCKTNHLKQLSEEFEKRLTCAIELPDCRPISVARALIDMKRTFDENGIHDHGFRKMELRQIAEHLLVYCNGGVQK